jgi:hypothetical protein
VRVVGDQLISALLHESVAGRCPVQYNHLAPDRFRKYAAAWRPRTPQVIDEFSNIADCQCRIGRHRQLVRDGVSSPVPHPDQNSVVQLGALAGQQPLHSRPAEELA